MPAASCSSSPATAALANELALQRILSCAAFPDSFNPRGGPRKREASLE